MDKATVGGLAMGTSLLVLSIMIAPGASFGAFIDYPSMAVVIGGAIAASCIAFPLKTLLQFPRVLRKVLMPNTQDLRPVIAQLVECAEIARRDGVLALENKTQEIEDPFLLLGIQMAVDGTDAELMEKILRSEMEAVAQRHKTGQSLMATLGRYAPAFGMIGTLMGLIIMLGNMDDPEAIGPGMAVALITTLYGAVVSNLLFLPFADKLAFYSKREMEVREIILRGLLSIQEGDNPRVLEQKLKICLPVSERQEEAKAA
ncbi:MAG: motility protein A [Planctomycetes bacterium]|nr:motility protein A [Planctomycetota bacterium]